MAEHLNELLDVDTPTAIMNSSAEMDLNTTQEQSIVDEIENDENQKAIVEKIITLEKENLPNGIGDQTVVISDTLINGVLVESSIDTIVHKTESESVEKVIPKPEDEKLSMDEARRRNQAEFYSKRLTEVRNWLADCIGKEHVPEKATDLEENFRPGILLARLSHFFAPNLVSLEKIFDLDGKRFKEKGLEYRHTDNIVKWRTACQSVGIKNIVLPETADIYAGRNVRTIFALIALSKRLHRLGIGPLLHQQNEIVLTDEDYKLFTERMEQAEIEEGVDWEQIQLERHTIESSDFAFEIQTVVDEHIVEVTDNTLPALRFLCKTMNLSHNLYEQDFALEDEKLRLNKLLESNEALKIDLQELEANIGLLVKNFRSIKDQTDKKAEQDRKQEIEKAAQLQASSIHNLSDDSVYNASESSYEGEEEPRSLARVSCHTTQSDQRIEPDYFLTAKAHTLTLLSAGVHGETIKELLVSKDYIAVDEQMKSKIEEVQKVLDLTLQKLIQTGKLTDDGNFHDLLTAIFYDIRNESDRNQERKERKALYDKMMQDASKHAQQMMAQTEAYRKYENACLKNMTGGAPSINLAEDLNKKVRKFLSRKEKSIKKDPVKLSAEKMIKKGLLFMDDITTPKQVSKYSMIITPLDEPGYYKFQSVLDNAIKHTQTIVFEELLRREAMGQLRLVFDEPLVFDCLGLRRFLDRKFHAKSF